MSTEHRHPDALPHPDRLVEEWLRRSLGARLDTALSERVPDELLVLVARAERRR